MLLACFVGNPGVIPSSNIGFATLRARPRALGRLAAARCCAAIWPQRSRGHRRREMLATGSPEDTL